MLRIGNFFRGRSASPIPFEVEELQRPTSSAIALFERAFKSPPPVEPRHFVASSRRADSQGVTHEIAGYIHFSRFEAGVYLCGGLCVDSRVYKKLSKHERAQIAREGSLSRWLSVKSIAALGDKTAIFAYTGDPRSRRDAFAIGFVPTCAPYLLVQWHARLSPEARAALVGKVNAHGPF